MKLIFLFLIITLLLPAFALADPSRYERGLDAFENSRFDQAQSALEQAIAYENLSREQKAKTYKILALIALGTMLLT